MKTLSVSAALGLVVSFTFPLAMNAIARGVVLCAVVMLVAVCLRRASASVRYSTWMALMVGLLALPVGILMLPKWNVLPAWTAVISTSDDDRDRHRETPSLVRVAGGGTRNPGASFASSVQPRPPKLGMDLGNDDRVAVHSKTSAASPSKAAESEPTEPTRGVPTVLPTLDTPDDPATLAPQKTRSSLASSIPDSEHGEQAIDVDDLPLETEPVDATSPANGAAIELAGITESATALDTLADGSDQAPAASSDIGLRPAWLAWSVAVWVVGVVVIALRLMIGQANAMFLTSRYSPLNSTIWRQRLEAACQRLRGRGGSKVGDRRVTLWQSSQRILPMTWGIWRPKIVLPSDVDAWDHAQLDAVLLHELAHIQRRDCLWQWIAHLATAVYWLNPLVWFAAVRMRADRECACDDLVLGAGMSGVEYAKHLVNVSAAYPASKWSSPLAIAMARQSGFEERVVSLLDSNRSRRPVSLTVASVLGAGLFALVVSLSVSSTEAANERDAAPPATANKTQNQAAAPQPKEDAKRSTVAASQLKYTVTPKSNEIARNGDLWCTAKLTNNSKQPISVYWADYAFHDMYRFRITSATGRRIPNVRYWPPISDAPTAVLSKRIRRIAPGESVSYEMLLTPLPGGNCQTTFFDESGQCTIRPSLKLMTHSVIDENTGAIRRVPDVWLGELTAEPFTITVGNTDSVKIPPIKELFKDRVRIDGHVLSDVGKPVGGAIVRAFHRHSSQSYGGVDGFYSQMIGQTQTDDVGRFSFIGLPASSPEFRIEAWHAEYPMTVATVAHDTESKKLKASIKFHRPYVISGTVVDPDNKPLSGVRINSMKMTDANGKFQLVSRADTKEHRLDVWHRGFNSVNFSVTTDEVKDGSLKITLVPKQATTITGVALFPDGTPLSLKTLVCSFAPIDRLDDANSTRRNHTTTDVVGRFQLTLPDAREYRMQLMAEAGLPGDRHLPHRAWISDTKRAAGMSKDVKFTFENRGRIKVSIVPDNQLPDFVKFNVDLHLTKFDNRVHLYKRHGLSPDEDITFGTLSPGKYSVSVMVEGADSWAWNREIEIVAGNVSKPVDAKFELPRLEYGRLRASTADASGRAMPGVPVTVYAMGGHQSRDTDAKGQVTFDRVPVGRVSLAANAPGYAKSRGEGRVTADGISEVETLVLKKETDEFGWVEGRILYEDGTPVRGAVIAEFGGPQVDADGQFRQRMKQGRQEIPINLNNSRGGSLSEGAWVGLGPSNSRVMAAVDVKPGQTIKPVIRVPRNPTGRLKVSWNAEFVDGAHLYLEVEAGNLTYRRVVSVKANEKSHTFEKLPSGRRMVRLNRWNGKRLQLVGVLAANAPVKNGLQELKLDATNVGTFAMRVFDADHRPVDDVEFSLAINLGPKTVHLIGWRGVDGPRLRNEPKNKRPTTVRRLNDGTLVVTNLQAGHYSLTAKRDKWSDTANFNIKAGGGAMIEFRMQRNGQPVKPKVRDIDTLLKDLRSQYMPIKAHAVFEAGLLAAAGADAAKPLVEALDDSRAISLKVSGRHGSSTVAGYAEESLAKIGKPAIPALIEGLGTRKAEGRRRAATVLGQLDATAAVQPLIDLFDDDDRQVQGAAASALGNIQAALPKLVEMLDTGSVGQRKLAASALQKHQVPQAVAALIRALDHENDDVRVWAAYSLQSSKDATFTAALIKQLADENKKVRQSVTMALWRIGGDANDELIKGLADDDWRIRAGCAAAINHTLSNNRTAAAIEPLRKCMRDDVVEVRRNAFLAYGDCVYIAAADDSIPDLVAGLTDKDTSVRSAAANVLSNAARQWPERKEAVEPLIAGLKDTDKDFVRNCIVALGEYRDRRAVEPLLALTVSAEETDRAQLLYALASIGDRRAIPFMRSAFKEKVPAAIRSLGVMGDRESIPGLIALLKDSDRDVRTAALRALEEIPAEAAVEPLIEYLRQSVGGPLRPSRGDYAIHSIARALAKTGSAKAAEAMVKYCEDAEPTMFDPRDNWPSEETDGYELDAHSHAFAAPLFSMGLVAKPALIAGLQSKGRRAREVCLDAIYNMAVQGGTKRSDFNDAIPALVAALDDREPTVRRLAAKCVGYLEVKSAVPRLIRLLDEPLHAEYRTELDELLKRTPADSPGRKKRSGQPSFVIRDVARALGWIGAENAIPTLAKLLDHEDHNVQIAAAGSMGSARDPQIVDQLIRAMTRPHLAESIARTLGYTQDQRAVPKLRDALKSGDIGVRAAAAKSLGMLAAKSAEPDLIAQLSEIKPSVKLDSAEFNLRVNCIVSLVQLGSDHGSDSLKAAFASKDNTARRRLASALSRAASGAEWRPSTRFKNEAALVEIRRVARFDAHPVVRLHAIGALAGQTDEATIATLKSAQIDWSEFVQNAAKKLLAKVQ